MVLRGLPLRVRSLSVNMSKKAMKLMNKASSMDFSQNPRVKKNPMIKDEIDQFRTRLTMDYSQNPRVKDEIDGFRRKLRSLVADISVSPEEVDYILGKLLEMTTKYKQDSISEAMDAFIYGP